MLVEFRDHRVTQIVVPTTQGGGTIQISPGVKVSNRGLPNRKIIKINHNNNNLRGNSPQRMCWVST